MVYFLPIVNILKSAFSSFDLPLTGEGKNIMTSINLTMCFSFKQQQAEKKNMSRYLYNIGVAPNSGHKDKLHCETVKIQNIFRYMGKKLIQRQGCH